MASATTANIGDLVLVAGPPTNSSQHASGLYYVVGVVAGPPQTYTVSGIGQDNTSTASGTQQVPQSRVAAVYHQD